MCVFITQNVLFCVIFALNFTNLFQNSSTIHSHQKGIVLFYSETQLQHSCATGGGLVHTIIKTNFTMILTFVFFICNNGNPFENCYHSSHLTNQVLIKVTLFAAPINLLLSTTICSHTAGQVLASRNQHVNTAYTIA